jgi:hypothetical protein
MFTRLLYPSEFHEAESLKGPCDILNALSLPGRLHVIHDSLASVPLLRCLTSLLFSLDIPGLRISYDMSPTFNC